MFKILASVLTYVYSQNQFFLNRVVHIIDLFLLYLPEKSKENTVSTLLSTQLIHLYEITV